MIQAILLNSIQSIATESYSSSNSFTFWSSEVPHQTGGELNERSI